MMGRWDLRWSVREKNNIWSIKWTWVDWIQTSIAYGQEKAYGEGYYNKNGK